MQKIGKNSYIDICNDFLIMKIRKSDYTHILLSLGFLGFWIWALFWPNNEIQLNESSYYIGIFMLIFFLSTSIYNLTLRDYYEIDMNRNIVLRRKYIIGILIKQTEIKWDKDSNYLYEVEYDSYKNVTAVWLTSFQREKNKKRRLLKFYDMKTFQAFRVIFQSKYPSYPIGEWYD